MTIILDRKKLLGFRIAAELGRKAPQIGAKLGTKDGGGGPDDPGTPPV